MTASRCPRAAAFQARCSVSAASSQIHPSLNSSVHTLKLFSVLGPKVWLIGHRPRRDRGRSVPRPLRGVLFRASKVYQ